MEWEGGKSLSPTHHNRRHRRRHRQGIERGAGTRVEWGRECLPNWRPTRGQKEGSVGKWVISRALLGFANLGALSCYLAYMACHMCKSCKYLVVLLFQVTPFHTPSASTRSTNASKRTHRGSWSASVATSAWTPQSIVIGGVSRSIPHFTVAAIGTEQGRWWPRRWGRNIRAWLVE